MKMNISCGLVRLTLALTVISTLSDGADQPQPFQYEVLVRKGITGNLRVAKDTWIPMQCDAQGKVHAVQICGETSPDVGVRVAASIPSIDDLFMNVGTSFVLDKAGGALLSQIVNLKTMRWNSTDAQMAGADWRCISSLTNLSVLKLSSPKFPIETLRSLLPVIGSLPNVQIELLGWESPDEPMIQSVHKEAERFRSVIGDSRVSLAIEHESRITMILQRRSSEPVKKSASDNQGTNHTK
ncbi:MAG: hypothetical protein JNM99_14730 [Verrucomicrobiaceae bacterium]|nr:hypothetical protein [Verrucomicrobiaceae bacterium]